MKALFIGAHNDDIHYSAGGMAYLLKQAGFDLYFLNVSCKRRLYKKYGNTENHPYQDPKACEEFARQDIAAGDVFGAKTTIVGGYKDDFFVHSNENVLMLRDAIEENLPDIAFIPWVKDNHSEHVQVSRSAFQALCSYTSCEVHAYEAGPWQSMVHMQPDFLIDITSAMPTIEKSLLIFDQPSAGGKGLLAEKTAAAQFRGYMAGYPYGEAYKILRWPPRRLGNEMMLPKLLGDAFRWGGSDQYPMGLQYYL